MRQVVCNTKFKIDPFGDGGSKRSVQIRDILANNGLVFEEDDFKHKHIFTKSQLVRLTFKAMSFIRKYYPRKQIKSLYDYVRLVKYYALRIPVVYDKYVNRDIVFLWENTNDKDMLYLLKATGNPVIGMPHNIESLVTKHSVEALDGEVFNLQQCDCIFAISKEETWLLRLLGMNAFYLPYYPPKQAESHLFSIRKQREDRKPNTRKTFLLLGSVSNSPTRIGMQKLLDYAASKPLPFDLRVAGYETESLSIPQHPDISFWGTVTNDELDRLLGETDAVLIYQPPTTGALTRIPEMLVAGIPVFVNFDAGRNVLGMRGVHVYESFEDLFDSLNRFEPYQTELLQRDVMAESRFVKTIKSFVV